MNHVSRAHSIITILRKDLRLFTRDFLFLFMTILSVVTFVTLYWVLPRDVDESISLGVRGEGLEQALGTLAGEQEEGMALSWFETSESLRNAVDEKQVEIGIDFPKGFVSDIAGGSKVQVTVYARPNLPSEVTGAMSTMVKEIAYAVAGYQLPITEPSELTVVLGVDRAGEQIPFRDRMKPLYAFMVLIMEAIALGTLISSEIQERTLSALLSTPARVGDILTAKILVGAGVAFSEAMIITFLIQGFGSAPGIVILALLLGALLVTGVAMVAGSAGKDLMGTMLLGLLMLIPMAIPGFAVLFPGSPAKWIQWLPSYGIVKAIVSSSAEGGGWSESAQYLGILAGWCVVSTAAGVFVLRRRAVNL